MSRDLPLPKELLHLVEKRQLDDRRKAPKASNPLADGKAPAVERRRRKRRKNPPAKGAK